MTAISIMDPVMTGGVIRIDSINYTTTQIKEIIDHGSSKRVMFFFLT